MLLQNYLLVILMISLHDRPQFLFFFIKDIYGQQSLHFYFTVKKN